MCVFWRGVCGGASKFWLRWPSSRASWISNAAFVSSPGNTIKGPINFQPEVWRSSGQHTHTHTHTPSSPSHMIAALSRALMSRRAAEVNKLMHHQNTPGQLEVKCAASPHAGKLAVYTWKTSSIFLFFSCQKAQWHRDFKRWSVLFKKSFYSLKLWWLYTALTFSDKFLHTPENDQRTLNLSEKLTQTYPILSFSSFFTPPFLRKKARNTAQTSLSSICRDIRTHTHHLPSLPAQ